MIDDIILHIGPPKTGTTTIQKALARSAPALLKRGIYVPGQENATCILKVIDKNRTIQKSDTSEFKKLNNVIESQGEAAFLDNPVSRILISCEFLSGFSDESLQTLSNFLNKDRIKTRVLMYIRNPVDIQRARVQEMLKEGHSYRNTVRVVGHRNRIVYRKYDRAFPGNIIPRIFKSKEPGWDVLTDFEEATGVKNLVRSSNFRENTSMSMNAAVALDELSDYSFENPIFSEIRRRALQISGDPFVIDSIDHAYHLEELKKDAEWCNNHFKTSFHIVDNVDVSWDTCKKKALTDPDVKRLIEWAKLQGCSRTDDNFSADD